MEEGYDLSVQLLDRRVLLDQEVPESQDGVLDAHGQLALQEPQTQ